jgi:hypothetical protein
MSELRDGQDLRSLVLGHYVAAAGTLVVGAFYTGIPMFIGVVMAVASRKGTQSADEAAAMETMAWMLSVAAVFVGIYFLLVVASLIASGVFISKRQRYRSCLALSAVSATSLMFYNPFGPGAAAFTYTLLRRPSIQARFGETQFPQGTGTRGEWDLKVLSLSCYMFAAFHAVAAIPGIAVMLGMARMPVPAGSEQGAAMHAFMVMAMAGFAAVVALAIIALYAALGYLLSAVRYRRVCMGLCIPLLLFFPFGTLLGIFLVILLSRSDVVAVFERTAAAGLAGGEIS